MCIQYNCEKGFPESEPFLCNVSNGARQIDKEAYVKYNY